MGFGFGDQGLGFGGVGLIGIRRLGAGNNRLYGLLLLLKLQRQTNSLFISSGMGLWFYSQASLLKVQKL